MKKFIYLFLLLAPVYAFALKEEVMLERCIDGDTAEFILNKEKIKVRFLAIDTPETKHPRVKEEPFGKEASELTCSALTNANKIYLEYDDKSSKTDKYQRHLAWVWADDTLIQEDLVKNGLAEVKYIYGKYKYLDDLYKYEKLAKKEKLNIWDKIEKVSVTYNYLDNKEITFIEKGSKLNNPKIKIENHYILYWTNNKELYFFGNEVNDDLTLEAEVLKIYPLSYVVIVGVYMLITYLYKKNKSKLNS